MAPRKKLRSDPTVPHTIQDKHTLDRMNYLLHLARLCCLHACRLRHGTNHGAHDTVLSVALQSRVYVKAMRSLSAKMTVPMTAAAKATFCKHCNLFMFDGLTCSSMVLCGGGTDYGNRYFERQCFGCGAKIQAAGRERTFYSIPIGRFLASFWLPCLECDWFPDDIYLASILGPLSEPRSKQSHNTQQPIRSLTLSVVVITCTVTSYNTPHHSTNHNMVKPQPTSIRAAVKDRHLSRTTGKRSVKNGAGGHNWGNEMDDVDYVDVPYEEAFLDEQVDLNALQNADEMKAEPRLQTRAI